MLTMDEGPGSPFQQCSKRCVSSDTIKSDVYGGGISESFCSVADLSREKYALRM
ncbi:hypothetical protein KDH_04840 [Dictyobacter sp. S3.2.2.5]|uniref:Uncharacterized protein n=1 Tax=Dictyobacter halimunensis TaxID=3026934 RepID=A0ABQ6FJ23_9CHLR|nr:hypothetical protein KDH_04840 [Dictyobacter sp. S3.2.2.5]